MASQRGQATIEWTGVVLLVALALAALAAVVSRVDGRALGGSVAHALTCAARGGCAAERGSPASAAPRASRRAPPSVPAVEVAGVPAERRLARPSVQAGGRAGRPRDPAARAAAASEALRGVGKVAKRLWIVCLGYRRYRYELERPRAPSEALPLDEAFDLANRCLNPLEFLAGD